MFSLVGSVAELIVFVLGAIGLPGLFALTTVESFGVPPLPSEVILPFAGYLVAEGTFSFYGALGVAVLGGLVGAYAAYAVGRWGRHRIERIAIGSLRLEPRHLETMDRFFARHGEATVAIARLVPVVRSYISYPAGTSRMHPVRFGVYTTAGLVPFAAAFLYLGVVLRSHWSLIESLFRWFDYAALAGIVLAGIYLYLVLTERLAPGWPPRRNRPARAP
ncbi:MAG TPA: DedA family protein [Thermoplasmata archaeon]|nr:DedA family protein [Thermoplasmata archaeon]